MGVLNSVVTGKAKPRFSSSLKICRSKKYILVFLDLLYMLAIEVQFVKSLPDR